MAKRSGGSNGGYTPGGRPQKGGSDRLTDSSGPSDKTAQDKADFSAKRMGVESFKSSENQKGGSASGVQDTSSGDIKQLKRSTPEVGVYHSEGKPRGGQATGSYDSNMDSDRYVQWDQFKELRDKQDRAAGRSGKDD